MLSRVLLAVTLLTVASVGALRPTHADEGESEIRRALRQAREVEAELVRSVDRARGAAVSIVGRRVLQGRPAQGGARPLPLTGVGSGVVVQWKGIWVLTNEHVVHGEQHIEAITPDGARHRLRIRATSRGLDLALLAFERVPPGVRPVDLERAAASDVPEGTWVLATGNPFFLALDGNPVTTLGVVSGMRPADPQAYLNVPTLQHDAEINPGSSGGALWGLDGRLLGINGTIATRMVRSGGGPAHTGASFSVPVAAVRGFLGATVRPPRVVGERPRPTESPAAGLGTPSASALGVRFRTGRDAQGRPVGAVVGEIVGAASGSSPRATGLRPGDLVTRLSVGGRTYVVRTSADIDRLLARQVSGATLTLRYYRGGRVHAWTGRLGRP